MTARNHHYLSQCYLKGFADGGGKASKLTVFDLKQKKYFTTTPRNVGAIRDFNRINADGVDPNILEGSLSSFETKAATALKKLRDGASFDGDIREVTLNLVALLAIRSPQMREHWRNIQAQIAERIMDLTLFSKERWESQTQKMVEAGAKVNENVTYEDVKQFYESKQYTIEIPRECHIRMEFVGVDAILPTLLARKWLVVRATGRTGPLVTSDHPVSLTWNEPDKVPRLYRDSPGFGLKGTEVYFPLSSNAALIGEFEGHEGVIDGTKELVAGFNSQILRFTYKQFYSPKLSFYFLGKNQEILDGKYLLKDFVGG
jgi:hypothetical protein